MESNFVRFHSHCEPEAAFAAADELGMLLQPELSHWGSEGCLWNGGKLSVLPGRTCDLLKTYANHPSFVMLTLGNELQAQDEGRERMRELVRTAKRMDPTRCMRTDPMPFMVKKDVTQRAISIHRRVARMW